MRRERFMPSDPNDPDKGWEISLKQVEFGVGAFIKEGEEWRGQHITGICYHMQDKMVYVFGFKDKDQTVDDMLFAIPEFAVTLMILS